VLVALAGVAAVVRNEMQRVREAEPRHAQTSGVTAAGVAEAQARDLRQVALKRGRDHVEEERTQRLGVSTGSDGVVVARDQRAIRPRARGWLSVDRVG
jgi:hypothetical protein